MIAWTHLSIEEKYNVLTHAFGLCLSVIGTFWLLLAAHESQDFWKLSSALLFGASMIFLYTSSTLYHGAISEEKKRMFKIMDHAAIYCLIAGSYTPFTLITLREGIGTALFTTVWTIALFGILFKLLFTGRFRLLSTLLYLGMGWLSVIAFEPVQNLLSPQALWLLLAGGLSYTVGSFIYLLKKPRFHHAIWHLFVLAGSICHYFTVLLFVF